MQRLTLIATFATLGTLLGACSEDAPGRASRIGYDGAASGLKAGAGTATGSFPYRCCSGR